MGAIISHPLDLFDDLPDASDFLFTDDSPTLFSLLEIFQLFNKPTSLLST